MTKSTLLIFHFPWRMVFNLYFKTSLLQSMEFREKIGADTIIDDWEKPKVAS